MRVRIDRHCSSGGAFAAEVLVHGREFKTAVCVPFTPTEIELLDANDGESIEDTYPTLASRIEKEIETGYLNDTLMQGRKRGMSCTAATRHCAKFALSANLFFSERSDVWKIRSAPRSKRLPNFTT
jgi:hypothetical protein